MDQTHNISKCERSNDWTIGVMCFWTLVIKNVVWVICKSCEHAVTVNLVYMYMLYCHEGQDSLSVGLLLLTVIVLIVICDNHGCWCVIWTALYMPPPPPA